MRTPRRGLLALATVAGAALALIIPSAASAAYYGSETDYALSSSGPTDGYECVEGTGVIACFRAYGDVFYVKDTKADGYSAVAEWHMLGFATRTGSCVNKLGEGEWGICNKNLTEGRELVLTAARYNSGNFVDYGSRETLYT
ncbi:hypothetical protein ACFP2T_26985 [Plantactinospora solaniradicis]|uniref:Secreted protein n=1 Tax=Plantactinospora solaniradicis TaxID=1723736 RepID=A0ABW1KF02_9ACTN